MLTSSVYGKLCPYSIAVRSAGQPRFSFFRQGWDYRFLQFYKGAQAPPDPCGAGTSAFGNRTRSQSRQRGLFKGGGAVPRQAETGFWRSRRKPVSSLCGNKDTVCKVALFSDCLPEIYKVAKLSYILLWKVRCMRC